MFQTLSQAVQHTALSHDTLRSKAKPLHQGLWHMAGAEVRHIPTRKYFALKKKKKRHEGSRKAQPVNTVNRFTTKPDDLSSKPGTHTVDGESTPGYCPLGCRTYSVAHTTPYLASLQINKCLNVFSAEVMNQLNEVMFAELR